MKKFLQKISGNPIIKNLLLAFCSIIVFIFIVSILLNLFTRHGQQRDVPDFSGMNIEEATKLARKSSVQIDVNDSLFVPAFEGGIILDQLPKGGSKVKSGRKIFVTVNSYRQRMVKVPYVTGFSLRQARNNIEMAGLEIDRLIYRDDMATNYVLEQRTEGRIVGRNSDIQIEEGSGITLVVGKAAGEGYTSVPKVVGFPLAEAKNRLWEAGLNVGSVNFDEGITLLNQNEARVYIQSPEQGRRLELGTPITVTLSLDGEKIESGSQSSDKAAKNIIATQHAAQEQEAAEEAELQTAEE